MEKLKLTEQQKYCLLQDAVMDVKSQGRYPHSFLSPYECDRISFRSGLFSKRNGARVEVVYSFRNCTVTLLWNYVRVHLTNGSFNFVFIPKTLTIDREFKSSLLISVLPDLDRSGFIYQSTKSLYELCVEDSEEGEADVPDGVCHVEADDNTASDVNPYAVQNYHFEGEDEHSVIL